jgi:hypothetical protein
MEKDQVLLIQCFSRDLVAREGLEPPTPGL